VCAEYDGIMGQFLMSFRRPRIGLLHAGTTYGLKKTLGDWDRQYTVRCAKNYENWLAVDKVRPIAKINRLNFLAHPAFGYLAQRSRGIRTRRRPLASRTRSRRRIPYSCQPTGRASWLAHRNARPTHHRKCSVAWRLKFILGPAENEF